MMSHRRARRGGQGGRGAGCNQVDEQLAEQVAYWFVAPITPADLILMQTMLDERFRDIVTKLLAQHQLAQAVSAQGRATQQNLSNKLLAETKNLRDFMKYDSQTFDGSLKDLTKAEL